MVLYFTQQIFIKSLPCAQQCPRSLGSLSKTDYSVWAPGAYILLCHSLATCWALPEAVLLECLKGKL